MEDRWRRETEESKTGREAARYHAREFNNYWNVIKTMNNIHYLQYSFYIFYTNSQTCQRVSLRTWSSRRDCH